MSRKANVNTPTVKSLYLYTTDEATTGIKLDSAEWFAWLEAGNTFYFDGIFGGFTARAEKRRQGLSWYAFKKINGKLHKRYIGRNAALSIDHLRNIAQSFN